MLERILVAGSGGQGVILAGRLLALTALDEVPHVTFFPAYGAEVRGGTSHGHVILSDREIASPVADRFDSMLILNAASAKRFLDRLAPEGLAVLNASLASVPEGIEALRLDATRLASEQGDVRAANMLMLGAFLARKPILSLQGMERCIAAALSRKGADICRVNLLAFRAGVEQAGG